jgi:hypothetical protein
VEALKALAKLGLDIGARTPKGATPLQASIHYGHHEAAQVLRELERTARAQKAAARERAQQAAAKERAQEAARQDAVEKREAADRVAAEIMEEEEREEAAKVRLSSTLAPHRAPQRECSWVVSDAAFLSHG